MALMLQTHFFYRELPRQTQDSQRSPSLDEVSNRLGFQRRVLNFYKTFLLVMYTVNCVFL